MSYTYLFELYELLDRRLADARDAISATDDPAVEAALRKGRIRGIEEIRSFLADHYEPKLPRRLRGNGGRRTANGSRQTAHGERLKAHG